MDLLNHSSFLDVERQVRGAKLLEEENPSPAQRDCQPPVSPLASGHSVILIGHGPWDHMGGKRSMQGTVLL